MVFLLSSWVAGGLISPATARGRFVLAAKLPDFSAIFERAMHVPWLGPGLVIAFVLLVTLRGARRVASKPLQRVVHVPRLERYKGALPRRHKDLEV